MAAREPSALDEAASAGATPRSSVARVSQATRIARRGEPVRVAQLVLAALLASSIPAGILAAFAFEADRNATGDAVSVTFFVSFLLLLSTPWWPAAIRRTRAQRLESTCLIWFGLTFSTHLTWELGWLLLRERIIAARAEPWAFAWWMYIDGGDRRYASDSPLLVSVELLSVCNGLLGVTALWLRRRARGSSAAATLMLMATAVVHVYSALLYLATELVAGCPNVDTTSFVDLWIKFTLLNGLWIAMPCVVMYWGAQTLKQQLTRP